MLWRDGLAGIGDGGQETIPAPRHPLLDQFSTKFILVGSNFAPFSSLNRGILRGKSGIGPVAIFISESGVDLWPEAQCGWMGRDLANKGSGAQTSHV